MPARRGRERERQGKNSIESWRATFLFMRAEAKQKPFTLWLWLEAQSPNSILPVCLRCHRGRRRRMLWVLAGLRQRANKNEISNSTAKGKNGAHAGRSGGYCKSTNINAMCVLSLSQRTFSVARCCLNHTTYEDYFVLPAAGDGVFVRYSNWISFFFSISILRWL